jgi:hypothetical protein
MPKQTAVEWLFEQIPFEWSSSQAAFEALQQAKEMERQEIINAVDGYPTNLRDLDGGDYYEQAYGGKDAGLD